MDWKECVRKRIAKEVTKDEGMIKSLRETAAIKVESANSLPDHLYIGKISLLYDALRENLECLALENRYKIYNHECYTALLKELLNLSREGDIFDELRKIRNSINYYGKKLTIEESRQIIENLKYLINKFKNSKH